MELTASSDNYTVACGRFGHAEVVIVLRTARDMTPRGEGRY